MARDLAILQRSGAPTRFVVGPWPHAGVDPEISTKETLRWFDRHLKGDTSVDTGATARVFVMPKRGWRDLAAWPPRHEVKRWSLQPGGGMARTAAPVSDATPYHYDAADPTPSFGGASLRPDHAGPVDNRDLEARDDVLTFTTDVLPDPLEVIGPVAVELFLSSSVEDLDVFVRVCDVHPDGRSINVADGIRRLRPNDIKRAPDGTFPVDVRLWPTAYDFGAGHRIRLQVSGGAHPLYARNTCSGEPLGSARTIVVAHNAVHHDPAHPSALLLPLAG
jgi:putative CocE/NonD family hydrolase